MMSHQPNTYRMTTLGCRVNHAEQREMESVLQSRGFRPATPQDAPALEVIHTCSVTGRAAAKSRQAIRRAIRTGEESGQRVIVTGCFVGTDPEIAKTMVGEHAAIGHADHEGHSLIERFREEIDRWTGTPPANRPASSCQPRIVPLPLLELPSTAAVHTRAEIRIQDGCDAHCTFCIIPKIRPSLRSKRIEDVAVEARKLVELGHREIVLSGIFIGAYGHHTALRRRQTDDPAARLPDLLDRLSSIEGLERLRISSMEPMDVTDELLDAMIANEDVVVPHLHLPLQSGSNQILRRMNRQYRVEEYLDMIERCGSALTRNGLPPAITTDIICGFPGETEEDFQATCDIASKVGYLHMHVFPFSPRRGTAAARWAEAFVPPSEAKKRVQDLIKLETDPDQGLAVNYRRRLLGRTLRMIVEQPEKGSSIEEPAWQGRCDNYEMLTVKGDFQRGEILQVQVEALDGPRTLATISDRRDLHLPVLPTTSSMEPAR
ncbi:MAG: MiaB/RimO family radical SAM methylthiotransferase [Phycisphaerales bacterium]|nr:MiaB/RimO family radical SAM methylthiotransferase [Phycisphaerales bacterium]